MRPCSEVVGLRDVFVALELEPGVEREVRAHLESCRSCRDAFLAAEPSLALSLGLAAAPAMEDDLFVPQVLSGIRLRRVERRARGHQRWWIGMAAAAVLAVLGSTTAYLRLQRGAAAPPAVVAESPAPVEPASLEVEGADVRLYQLTARGADGKDVQVAFVVDPRLEL